MAERTMNTLLHVMEAYTELLRVTGREDVREKLHRILEIMLEKVFDPEKNRLRVFFDRDYNELLDLYSLDHGQELIMRNSLL
jgi:mannobiose 2-epimerase